MGEAQITPYEQLGGAEKVKELVDRFYDNMDILPETETIRKLHPQDLTDSRNKLYMFLSGWLGGPPLYEQIHGHPRLRARHLPFAIGARERDQWLTCMHRALDQMELDAALRHQLEQSFLRTANFMRNQGESPHELATMR